MPFKLDPPEPWAAEGWRIKIRDRERNEPPHVTVLRKDKAWRVSLRDGTYLDDSPPMTDVPKGLRRWIEDQRASLVPVWDRMYPENPVRSEGEADD